MTTERAPWLDPATATAGAAGAATGLRLFNSLTKNKDLFVPSRPGRQVRWYICGPTVYDAAHMGHARAYITFDILRRAMEQYFGYDIVYQMNITDIDDKIILRARQNYLFDQFVAGAEAPLSTKFLEDLCLRWTKFVEAKIGAGIDQRTWEAHTSTAEFQQRLKNDAKLKMHYEAASAMHEAIKDVRLDEHNDGKALLEASRDIVAPQLDAESGSTVTDHKIFQALTAFWEADFLRDMEQLNVRRPDALTRVTEYVPKIVTYIEKIIANGYAYVANGSVYFDVEAFHGKDGHFYAKLEPSSAHNTQLLEEGEGAISGGRSEKRKPWDFALWKASRPGEPVWPSPWSQGRPGWHIECSVMASDLFGDKLDVHSGGIDLAFPHHDNEIAQAEAHYGCKQWVNYFLHAGHLHIEGQKMSKSLKNFITIKDALRTYSGRQMRILFLMHTWSAVLDFKADSMTEAIAIETTFKNYFSNVQALIRASNNDIAIGTHNKGKDEDDLLESIGTTERKVYEAMCDSIDTPRVLDALLELVKKCNTYMNSRKTHNIALLLKGANYVQRILKIFGVLEQPQDFGFGLASTKAGAADVEAQLVPLLQTLASFRDGVRTLLREKRDPREILALSDKLRDEDLPELGVRLEDREGAASLIKLDDRATLMREREDKKAREAEAQRKRQEQQAKLEAKRIEKEAKGRVRPDEMFKAGENASKYSQWDERGIPTHDAAGAALSKNQRKAVVKEYEAQVNLREEMGM